MIAYNYDLTDENQRTNLFIDLKASTDDGNAIEALGKLEEFINDTVAEHDKFQEEIGELEEDLRYVENREAELEDDIDELRDDKRELQNKIDELEARK